MKQSISHYSSCAGLDSIHIVWSEPNPPSESLVEHLNHILQSKSKGARRAELKFDINKEDSLNNRFKEIKDLKTDAVFSIDDDVIFPCSSVEFAFSVWQSAPDNMVGFVPRSHWIDQLVWLRIITMLYCSKDHLLHLSSLCKHVERFCLFPISLSFIYFLMRLFCCRTSEGNTYLIESKFYVLFHGYVLQKIAVTDATFMNQFVKEIK